MGFNKSIVCVTSLELTPASYFPHNNRPEESNITENLYSKTIYGLRTSANQLPDFSDPLSHSVL